MSRRRGGLNPKLFKRGRFWCIQIVEYVWESGKERSKHTIKRIAPLTMNYRKAEEVKQEYLRPRNQGLQGVGAAVSFGHYVRTIYQPTILPLLAKSSQNRYRGILKNHLLLAFEDKSLQQLNPLALQTFFTGTYANSKLQYETVDKIRDVLAAVLKSAKDYGLIVTNPIDTVRLPRLRRGCKEKPYITPPQFDMLLDLIPEPYATMVYVAIYTGLRVSELIALRWNDIDITLMTIRIDERCCRGDWDEPKTDSSKATIELAECVLERLERFKALPPVEVRTGGNGAKRKFVVCKSTEPGALIFQSIRDGKPMRDNNILSRWMKPAGRKLGLGFLNWKTLRTSCATWMHEYGAKDKAIQRQMRHSRVSTTMDIYTQTAIGSQRDAVDRMPVVGRRVN